MEGSSVTVDPIHVFANLTNHKHKYIYIYRRTCILCCPILINVYIETFIELFHLEIECIGDCKICMQDRGQRFWKGSGV